MFGEMPLFGQIVVKLDNKGRIFIPTSTCREKDERLLLVHDQKFNEYRLYSSNGYSKTLEKYYKKLNETFNDKFEKKLESMIKEKCDCVLREMQVDAQGRVCLGTLFKEYNELLLKMNYDYIKIEPVNDRNVKI